MLWTLLKIDKGGTQTRNDIDNVSRKEKERGLKSIEDCINART